MKNKILTVNTQIQKKTHFIADTMAKNALIHMKKAEKTLRLWFHLKKV